ncbi:hypothetical protein [Paenibacillus sp. FSL R5-0914]|uniref:hypothetical protein n=1 Tax=Paenibacillus sp. FSL R5-0914 TaxID=2921665 RepID=UPI0030F96015
MRILFIDLMSPIGHKNYNYGILRALGEFDEVDLLIRENYLDLHDKHLNINDISYIPDKYIPEMIISEYNNLALFKIGYRIRQFQCLKWIKKNFKLEKYDLIFFSSVDIISFSIATRFLKQRCVFVDHAISDINYSLLKRIAWKNLSKKLELIVLEPYIKEYMINEVGIRNKVWIIPHPLPKIQVKKNFDSLKDESKIIFAPSLSNDENFIRSIINCHEEIPENTKIIFKSKHFEVKLKKIEVYNSRITDEEYFDTMAKSSYILLPYDDKYNFKTSGILFEAAEMNLPILLQTNNTLKYYADSYPDKIVTFNNVKDLLEILNRDEENIKFTFVSHEKLLFDYSDKVISENINRIIKNLS